MGSEQPTDGCDERLIVFTRFPVLGQVKSRLAAEVGDQRALEVHDELARHAVEQARRCGAELEIRITGGNEDDWVSWLGRARWAEQGEGDLGERLDRAVDEAFADGAERVVVMGTDCPGLDARRLRMAFDQLARAEVVFGPALDGGYYLVGLNEAMPSLFEGIDWGTSQVLAQSMAKAPQAILLEPLGDVDVAADLDRMRGLPDSSPNT